MEWIMKILWSLERIQLVAYISHFNVNWCVLRIERNEQIWRLKGIFFSYSILLPFRSRLKNLLPSGSVGIVSAYIKTIVDLNHFSDINLLNNHKVILSP